MIASVRVRRGSALAWGAIGALVCLAVGCGPQPQGGACVADDSGGCLASVRLTYLNLEYDLSKPVYVNNRVPVEFGITATSPDPSAPATRNVAVSFSFAEADPADPSAPVECGSSALDLALVGDGQEHIFNGFIWPTTLCDALVGKKVNLRVEFDGGDLTGTGIDEPSVAFTEAARGEALNQACRSVADPDAADPGRGCVYDIDIEPTPSDQSGTLIDVRYTGLDPVSSVAVLPYADPASTGKEDLAPILVVQSTLVVDGRDPYVAGVAPAAVPAELEESAPGITKDLQFGQDPSKLETLIALPGHATLHYDLAPTDDESGWLPLTIGDPNSDESADRVSAYVVTDLLPGTGNTFAHELFAEGATRAALDKGGQWAEVSDFTLRGCFEADFAQRGNEGEPDNGGCRTIPVVLVREGPAASAASSITFDEELDRSLGDSKRLQLVAHFDTENRLDRGGAFSKVEGEVGVKGKLGRSFSLTVAHAVGQASLDAANATAQYEISVDAFDKRIYSVSQDEPNLVHDDDFSAAKSFSFPGLGFGFGPVHIGFKFSLGGEVSFGTSDTLTVSEDATKCQDLLGTTDTVGTCGSIEREATPGFDFTAAIEGGINLRVVKAAVVADLKLVDTSFPLGASLAWGLGDDGKIRVLGNANWKLAMQLIEGDVSIVGRVGIRRWAKTLRVNLFRFSSQRFTRTLLDRTMDGFEVLE